MNFLFCSDLNDSSIPDSFWEKEIEIASKYHKVYYLDQWALSSKEFEKAIRRLPYSDQWQEIIYRGWMMSENQYQGFANALLKKNYILINNIFQYLNCHYFANWYNLIKDYTPQSVITFGEPNFELIHKELKIFDKSSLVIKDFVKSQKHSWNDACFIYDVSDQKEVERVVNNFVKLQKDNNDFVGGVVFRKFVNLKQIGIHPKSKLFLSQEFRSFVYKGKIISTDPYWEYGDYYKDTPPKKLLNTIAKLVYAKLGSNFFTIDTAQLETGEWICIEIGDGQVSCVPDSANLDKFYRKFK